MNLYKHVIRGIAVSVVSLLLAGCHISQSVQAPPRYTEQQYVVDAQQPSDPALDKFIAPYRDSLASIMNRSLAYCPDALMTPGSHVPLATRYGLPNFMADVCLQRAAAYCTQHHLPAPDFLVFTAGGLRNSLPQGTISLGNLYELMPFENTLVVLKLDGTHTEQLLRFLASRSGGDPVAGVTLSKAQPEQAVIHGHAFDRARSYYVVTSDYLASGGDGLALLREAQATHETDAKVRDALIDYLKALTAAGDTLQPVYEQRIKP